MSELVSTLAQKYNLTEDAVKRLIRDGLLGYSFDKYEDVITEYNSCIRKGLPRPQAIANAAHVGRISERQVYRILDKVK